MKGTTRGHFIARTRANNQKLISKGRFVWLVEV